VNLKFEIGSSCNGGICSVLLEVIEKLHDEEEESTATTNDSISNNEISSETKKTKKLNKLNKQQHQKKNITLNSLSNKNSTEKKKSKRSTTTRPTKINEIYFNRKMNSEAATATTNYHHQSLLPINIIQSFGTIKELKNYEPSPSPPPTTTTTNSTNNEEECVIETSVVNSLFDDNITVVVNTECQNLKTLSIVFACVKCKKIFSETSLLNEHKLLAECQVDTNGNSNYQLCPIFNN
jgi:hypothetical protein